MKRRPGVGTAPAPRQRARPHCRLNTPCDEATAVLAAIRGAGDTGGRPTDRLRENLS